MKSFKKYISENIKTKRIRNGEHKVEKDGTSTDYTILNGSINVKGNGNNTYGIHDEKKNKTVWIGSLSKARKVVKKWLSKDWSSKC